jgi:cysteine-rich repeat protein
MSRGSRAGAFVSCVLLGALWGGTEVPAASPPFDITLVATGEGNIGANWISLPNATAIKTAEELCAAIGPNATTVAQLYPDVNRRYTWDCAGGAGACTTTNPAGTIPEPGCSASACFCIDDGEGYDVRVSADTTFHIDGCESPVTVNLPAGSTAVGGRRWLTSVPFATDLATWEDLAIAAGVPNTGTVAQRGSVTTINPVTGTATSCVAGTQSCMAAQLETGRAYRLTYLEDEPPAYTSPTSSPGPCADFDIDLIATGEGAIGTNWISLPTSTPIKTAEDLCAVVGPNATSVAQFFPDVNLRYTWSCAGGAGACTTTNPAGTIPEPGCTASACFCMDDGEGYDIRVSVDTPLHIAGCDGPVTINLPEGSAPGAGLNWLASVPFATDLATWEDLAIAAGVPNTGTIAERGSVATVNPITGTVITCVAGSQSCMTAQLETGRAYRLRYLAPTPDPYANPTSRVDPCFTCGNDAIEAFDEQCDDGNVAGGDCCSPACEFDPVDTACTPDADGCTSDLCDGIGICVHTGPDNSTCGDALICALTEVCDPRGVQGACGCGEVCAADCLGCLVAPVAGVADTVEITAFDPATGDITISYGPACQAIDHTIYWGDLVFPWDGTYTGQACNIGCSGTATFNPDADSIFFYVVPNDGADEGSYGLDSDGAEVPEAVGLAACDYPQDLTNACP